MAGSILTLGGGPTPIAESAGSDLESDSEDGTPPWARQTHNAPASLADGCGADTLGELEFGPKVPKTLAGGVPFPLDPRVAGSAAHVFRQDSAAELIDSASAAVSPWIYDSQSACHQELLSLANDPLSAFGTRRRRHRS